MAHQDVKTDISNILGNDRFARSEKVGLLERMRETARAEMRAATESPMVYDADVGDDLKLIDEALNDLNVEPESIEDGGAATL